MAIEFKKTAFSGNTPVIWRGECKILPGGFKPKQNFPIGTVLRRGLFIKIDFDEMTAGVLKLAAVQTGGSGTAARVPKGHIFVIGDKVQKFGDTKSTTVQKIDTSNADYDVVTLEAEIAGLKENDILIESDGEETASPAYVPNAIIGTDLEFKDTGIPTIDAAYEAVLLYNHLSHPIPEDWKQGMCLKSNPNIVLIKQ